ncbi:hypothetical protein RCL_jg27420.t1 [Rhizophagus clarus]|uniref:Uncharacterized protein n=1 Tax=Rhizophagus clarus TaxID=94130 RepID=A0A8H3QYG4_9GLOM|nr:hypothetical protein RCL_jg27420.t1 [Rhizophagus clarus]
MFKKLIEKVIGSILTFFFFGIWIFHGKSLILIASFLVNVYKLLLIQISEELRRRTPWSFLILENKIVFVYIFGYSDEFSDFSLIFKLMGKFVSKYLRAYFIPRM